MCLVKFKLQNFKSYLEEAEFSFEAQDSDFNPDSFFHVDLLDGRSVKLLKTAVIYGPNASGKSNLIWGLRALHYFVVYSRQFDPNFGIAYEPFALDSTSAGSDTKMTLEFIVAGRYYRYHIEYNSREFTAEQLYEEADGGSELVFSNESGQISIGPAWRSDTLDMSKMELLQNHLLLSELALKPANKLVDVYNAIARIKAEPVSDNSNLKSKVDNVTSEILHQKESGYTGQLNQILKKADLGIEGFHIIEHGKTDFRFPDSMPSEVKNQIVEDNRWEYKFIHQGKNGLKAEFQLGSESIGTQQAFSIGALLLRNFSEGDFMAYDELGMAMHPEMLKYFVSIVNDKSINPKNAQLLFTSHDTTLVAENVLRADQIWFTEKNESGESELYSAQDFDDMKIVVPFEDFYRRGRFGALPKIFRQGLQDGQKEKIHSEE